MNKDGPKHLESLENSISITSEEHRLILETKAKKIVSRIDPENDLDYEIDAYFGKNRDEKEFSVWPDLLIPSSLEEEWVWEDIKK